METYSINIGTSIEATSYDLSDSSQFLSLIERLEDNNIYMINPVDIRDSVLSLWSNCAFKQTSTGTVQYIGIDTGNPSDRDLKNKILIGKRSYSGTYSYTDPQTINIMNGLTASDIDIYFYNTTEDNLAQDNTKIQFMSNANINSPYLNIQYITLEDKLSMNFINQYKINVTSENERVGLNGIEFPKISEIADIDNKVLFHNGTYSNGHLEFDEIVFSDDSGVLGATGSELNLYGELNINGSSIEFSDDRVIPINIGDIRMGEVFNITYPLSELLRRVIYTYNEPQCSLSILSPYSSGYVEIGTNPLPVLQYTIYKKTLPTLQSQLVNMFPNIHPPINSSTYEIVSATASAIIITPIYPGTQTYTINVGDGISTNSNTVDITGIYPYFYGVGDAIFYTYMPFLSKLVEPKTDKILYLFGNGKVYFLSPKYYGQVVDILDKDDISISFIEDEYNYTSPEGYWASVPYYIYMSVDDYTLTSPTKFTFKY